MAAPSGTVWGSIVGDYGKIGIYKSLSSTNTTTSVTVQVWFWSKYSCIDEYNTLYYDNLSASGSASTSRGAVSINTTSNSGGWSTTNQVKLASYSYSYTRGTSAATRYLYAKLTDIDRVGGTMTVSTTFSVPKLATYTISYNANNGSGAPSAQTKYYGKNITLSSTKPTRTGYSFQGWGTSASATTVSYKSGATYSANASITLYAIWKANTYTVSYNANGGSGAPSAQTKTYGVALTLSSTKPTRTGYSFQGWGTSESDTSVDYKAGASYTSNAAITLYAIWKANTYTVSFDANGGSGAPSAQTKTYGVALTLSSTKPTRSNYTFQGWGTSASSTSASYQPGGSYTNNAAITLYAVWKLSYKKPRITSFSVDRCNSSGTVTEEGTYALVKFNWATDYTVTSVVIQYKLTTATSWTTAKSLTPGGTSGSVSQVIGGSLSTEHTYDVKVTVTDSGGNFYKTGYLGGTQYIIDIMYGGNGIAFGKPAETTGTFDVGWPAVFRYGVANKLLWSGGYYMTSGHTIALSEPVSKQLTGICLVFSRYENGAAADNTFISCFVSKYIVAAKAGYGHCFTLMGTKFSNAATKYLYISDDKIVGHDDNSLTGTGSNGIIYNNAAYVLRYVIGV